MNEKQLSDSVMRILAALLHSRDLPEGENAITIEQPVLYKGKKRTFVVAIFEKEKEK